MFILFCSVLLYSYLFNDRRAKMKPKARKWRRSLERYNWFYELFFFFCIFAVYDKRKKKNMTYVIIGRITIILIEWSMHMPLWTYPMNIRMSLRSSNNDQRWEYPVSIIHLRGSLRREEVCWINKAMNIVLRMWFDAELWNVHC